MNTPFRQHVRCVKLPHALERHAQTNRCSTCAKTSQDHAIARKKPKTSKCHHAKQETLCPVMKSHTKSKTQTWRPSRELARQRLAVRHRDDSNLRGRDSPACACMRACVHVCVTCLQSRVCMCVKYQNMSHAFITLSQNQFQHRIATHASEQEKTQKHTNTLVSTDCECRALPKATCFVLKASYSRTGEHFACDYNCCSQF